MELYTTSRATCWRRCQQEHQYGYEDGIRPRTVPRALGMGRISHDGVEHWRHAVMEQRPADECLALAMAAILLSVTSQGDETEVDDYDLVKCEELMRGYHFMWHENDSTSLEYIFVEKEFKTPMVNPLTDGVSRTWELGGKIDAAVKLRGHDYNVETKTTSSDIRPGSDYWQRLRIDGQVSQYYAGGRALGLDLWGCIYDVIKKPTMKPAVATPVESRKYTGWKICKGCKAMQKEANKKMKVADMQPGRGCLECEGPRLYANMRATDETPDEYRVRLRESIIEDPTAYFARAEVVRLEDDLKRYQLDAWRQAKSMRAVQLDGMPARNPDSCIRYGRFCSYWDVCTGAADIEDTSRFKRTRKHPELAVVV